MTDINGVIADYLATWNAEDEKARAEAAERAFAPGATYVDPLVRASGREDITAVIASVRQQFPGLSFTPGGVADGHHDVLRFDWNLGTPEEPDLIVGFDVVSLAADGRIEQVIGFLDKVPQG